MSVAVPKAGLADAAETANAEGPATSSSAFSDPSYSQYYEQYWADRAAWGNYGSFKVNNV